MITKEVNELVQKVFAAMRGENDASLILKVDAYMKKSVDMKLMEYATSDKTSDEDKVKVFRTLLNILTEKKFDKLGEVPDGQVEHIEEPKKKTPAKKPAPKKAKSAAEILSGKKKPEDKVAQSAETLVAALRAALGTPQNEEALTEERIREIVAEEIKSVLKNMFK